MILCKWCKEELNEYWPNEKATMDSRGYYFVCEDNADLNHEPMDNLDYIEHLAKQRNLV